LCEACGLLVVSMAPRNRSLSELRSHAGLSMRKSDEDQVAVADGTMMLDDDETHGFFAKGRDFESVGDAHM
jgi:hypothetical protein